MERKIATSNKNCRALVNEKKVFRAHNIFSEYGKSNTLSDELKYTVYSYGYHFPMYVNFCGQWYENKEKYSQTTSKQQSQSRPSSTSFVYLSTNELKDL